MLGLGPWELVIILVIVTMLFGVGRLPEVFGSVGKGIREFRNAASSENEDDVDVKKAVTDSSEG